MTTILFSDETLRLSVSKPLTTFGMFRRGTGRAMRLSQGQLAVHRPARITVTQEEVILEASRINAFRECCGFHGQAGGVPLSFPEIYFTPLMAQAMVSEAFPVSPLGIIHVRQTLQ